MCCTDSIVVISELSFVGKFSTYIFELIKYFLYISCCNFKRKCCYAFSQIFFFFVYIVNIVPFLLQSNPLFSGTWKCTRKGLHQVLLNYKNIYSNLIYCMLILRMVRMSCVWPHKIQPLFIYNSYIEIQFRFLIVNLVHFQNS